MGGGLTYSLEYGRNIRERFSLENRVCGANLMDALADILPNALYFLFWRTEEVEVVADS
jgi:hypothetical protein